MPCSSPQILSSLILIAAHPILIHPPHDHTSMLVCHCSGKSNSRNDSDMCQMWCSYVISESDRNPKIKTLDTQFRKISYQVQLLINLMHTWQSEWLNRRWMATRCFERPGRWVAALIQPSEFDSDGHAIGSGGTWFTWHQFARCANRISTHPPTCKD